MPRRARLGFARAPGGRAVAHLDEPSVAPPVDHKHHHEAGEDHDAGEVRHDGRIDPVHRGLGDDGGGVHVDHLANRRVGEYASVARRIGAVIVKTPANIARRCRCCTRRRGPISACGKPPAGPCATGNGVSLVSRDTFRAPSGHLRATFGAISGEIRAKPGPPSGPTRAKCGRNAGHVRATFGYCASM